MQALFGIHEQSLLLSGQRASLIANNIANADTPGYLAQDLDFKSILTEKMNHPNSDIDIFSANNLKYRIPNQVSVDGNTVDTNLEKAEFASNAMRWLASYTFLNEDIKGIRSALRGE